MTLKDLYSKVASKNHDRIMVVPEAGVVIYDAGAVLYEAYITADGTLIPRTKASKDALAAL